MRPTDAIFFAARALFGVRMRTMLMLLAMAISVGAVIVLTSLGDAARHFVTGKFSSLGTNLLIVLPGRSETTGAHPPLLGVTPRDLTLDDAESLLRSRNISSIAPIVVGTAPVSFRERDREATILGTTASYLAIRQLSLREGKFLPVSDFGKGRPVCVLGSKMVRELFDNRSPLSSEVRIGANRFRVIGVLNPTGISIGVDLDDIAVIPVALAQSLFNTESLFRVIVQARSRESLAAAEKAIVSIIRGRHDGDDDITVVTQNAVLGSFDRIFTSLTLTVAGIGAVSLLVAGILIMNVMLVAVAQRTGEIGLLKALGTPARQILLLFLAEAAILAATGALLGIAVGLVSSVILGHIFPDFHIVIPLWALLAAVAMALATGIIFALLPALRAARLEPVMALSRRHA